MAGPFSENDPKPSTSLLAKRHRAFTEDEERTAAACNPHAIRISRRV